VTPDTNIWYLIGCPATAQKPYTKLFVEFDADKLIVPPVGLAALAAEVNVIAGYAVPPVPVVEQ